MRSNSSAHRTASNTNHLPTSNQLEFDGAQRRASRQSADGKSDGAVDTANCPRQSFEALGVDDGAAVVTTPIISSCQLFFGTAHIGQPGPQTVVTGHIRDSFDGDVGSLTNAFTEADPASSRYRCGLDRGEFRFDLFAALGQRCRCAVVWLVMHASR